MIFCPMFVRVCVCAGMRVYGCVSRARVCVAVCGYVSRVRARVFMCVLMCVKRTRGRCGERERGGVKKRDGERTYRAM